MDDDTYPAAFIVFDKVQTSDANFKKRWLLHSQEEPKVSGKKITIERTENGFGGKLVNYALSPSAVDISVIGGDNSEMYYIKEDNTYLCSIDAEMEYTGDTLLIKRIDYYSF